MGINLNPHISFRDEAKAAMEFYQSVFGGELTMSTFADFQASDDPADQHKIMHAQLVTSAGLTLMASDTPSSMALTTGDNVSIALSGDASDELRRYFQELSAGGTPLMPLEEAPWGDTFGMCIDRFAVQWMVNFRGAAA